MISFKQFLNEVASLQPSSSGSGTLQGATAGGINNNWGGALPKLISILPPGNWFAGSQKRSKQSTTSGGVSDHYVGKTNAYACDFGLSSTFKGNKDAATRFCIDVANRAGQSISSWQPYIGNHLTFNTSDGYRVQLIWLSNVGGNHYDHVHLGVKAGANASQNINAPVTGSSQDGTESGLPPEGAEGESGTTDYASPMQAMQAVMQGVSDIYSFGKGQNL